MKPRTLLLLIPMLCFWILALAGIRRAGEGPWHSDCLQLWKTGAWTELQTLADNLWQLGDRDPESLYLAALSAARLHAPALTRDAARFLDSRSLNWTCETRLAAVYQPSSARQQITLYRTRLAYALLLLVGAANLASFATGRHLLPWSALASAIGCIILIL